ncbi:hypothetical protein [Parathalassolituus penaei]|uniref:Uncharacterized protein n=1 Tax=Parathalassolituus penaei TaxID=2997323 RepID=A0A9X3EGP9_9GAMM|nr:hypothetical protein [Parathalassolituus penaei]MCY0967199.1 hypothetical protein [Parathalassolituus penaei]
MNNLDLGYTSDLLVKVHYSNGTIDAVETVLQRLEDVTARSLLSQPAERTVLALPLMFPRYGYAHRMAARLALAGWSNEINANSSVDELRLLHVEALAETVLRLCQHWRYRDLALAEPLLQRLRLVLTTPELFSKEWAAGLERDWMNFERDEWETRDWLAELADDLENVYLPFDEDDEDVAVRVAVTGTGAHILIEQEGESVASLVREAAAAQVDQARQRLDALMPESESGEWLMSFQSAVYARNHCTRADESCGQVFTAQGWLQHRLTRNPESGQLLGWNIQTPADVNFALDGLLPQLLNGTEVSRQLVPELVRQLVLTIEPGVNVTVEVTAA